MMNYKLRFAALLSVFCIFSSWAMQEEDFFKSGVIFSATMALNATPDEIDELREISASQITKVQKVNLSGNNVRYDAILSNGDSLVASYFHGGGRDEYHCTRDIYSNKGNGNCISIPVDNKYFHLLKELAEKQKETTQKQSST